MDDTQFRRTVRQEIERALRLFIEKLIELREELNERPVLLISPHPAAGQTLADVERRLIRETLAFTKNNKTRAAGMLGISLKTLHNKLKEYQAQQPSVNRAS
jgi:DNA-binding NtrC family response regulator